MPMRKLGRKQAHREHLLRNLAASILLYEKVETTVAKAKAVRPLVDRSISLAKKDSLASRRRLIALYFGQNVVKKLFEVLAKRFADRPSGFMRIIKLGVRKGDGSEKVLVQLIPEAKPAEIKESKAKEKTDKETINAK